MAGSIATLNVKLTASIGAFASKMSSAAKPLASFAGGVAGAASKVTALAGAATALVAGGSLAVLVSNSMEAIDANAKLADRLGFTTESLVGLQHAAGLAGTSNEELTGALEKMLNNLNDAATKGGPAADALAQLGLDAKALAAGIPDAAFKVIADGLAGVQNPAQRASLAMDIFGKSGQGLLPLMMSGAEGIAAAQKEAEKLGLTYSRVDAAKVEAANDSITRMKSIVTGVGNQIAVGLAPYIDAAAVKVTEFATQGEGIGPKIGRAIEWVATAIASTTDYLNLGKAGFKLLQAGATLAVFGVVKAIDYMGSKVVDFLNLLPGVSLEWTTFTGQLADGLLEEANQLTTEAGEAFDSFSRGDNAKAVSRVFEDIRNKSQTAAEAVAANAPKIGGALREAADGGKELKKVADTLTDLQKQVEQFAMTDAQKKLNDLTRLGASPEQLAEAKKSMDQLDALNAARKRSEDMQEKAKSVFDSTRTPMEKYEQKIGELSDLLNSGAIDWNTYGRAVREAKGELEKSATADVQTPNAPEAITAGSAQALRFVYDNSRGVQRMNRDDASKKQLVEAEESTRLLDRIARNTDSGIAADQTVEI